MQSLATMTSKINTMITKTLMTMAVFYFIPSDLFFLHRPFNKVAICCVNYHASSVLHLLLSLLFTVIETGKCKLKSGHGSLAPLSGLQLTLGVCLVQTLNYPLLLMARVLGSLSG